MAENQVTFAKGDKVQLSGWIEQTHSEELFQVRIDRQLPHKLFYRSFERGDIVVALEKSSQKFGFTGKISSIDNHGSIFVTFLDKSVGWYYCHQFRPANEEEIVQHNTKSKELQEKHDEEELAVLLSRMSSKQIYNAVPKMCELATKKASEEKESKK